MDHLVEIHQRPICDLKKMNEGKNGNENTDESSFGTNSFLFT